MSGLSDKLKAVAEWQEVSSVVDWLLLVKKCLIWAMRMLA